jgi:hypothetical protein
MMEYLKYLPLLLLVAMMAIPAILYYKEDVVRYLAKRKARKDREQLQGKLARNRPMAIPTGRYKPSTTRE